MNQRSKLLITGASGFTGEHACKHFSEGGYSVIAVTRNRSLIRCKDVQTYYCELTNKNEVNQLIEKVKPDFFLHLAGVNHVGDSWKDPITTLEANVLSTIYLIDATRQLNPACRIVIVGSSLQTDFSDISNLSHPYSLSKTLQLLVSQAWVKLYNMNIVIVNPSNIIGPGCSNGINSILASKISQMEKNTKEHIMVVNNLNSTLDFIDVRDVVSGYEVLLKKGVAGKVYGISSGKSHSLRELIQIYKSLTTIDFKVESLSDEAVDQVIVEKPLNILKLGWRPTFSIQLSLMDTLNYFRNKK
ncbi:NAD(P)-dependent oxidoreductase [Bacillus sp. FDAARGOS_1420]|uniref:NAD-dependent epimerase/dehydratase family protein n=1 Tax=unclassified Bacillus (in: firmicutes) TaxID=185979 RepID=UPI001C5BD185|nr:NAD-dependent epimerase/dehydratase family protein [Bacillus sp. FDAARGOS_1420]MBW3496787.1 NAD-dependent epimerase/dehydratase family protein [Bacillus sp. FDAARGOS_1420]